MNDFITTNPYLYTGREKSFLRPNEYMKNGEYLVSPEQGAWRLALWGKEETHGTHSCIFIFRIHPVTKVLHIAWEVRFEAHDHLFAILQEDGNFCIYSGKSPESKEKLLWQTNTKQNNKVDWCATMQYDGNFCVYRSSSNTYYPGVIVWQAGFNSGLTDHYEYSDIIYDYEHMTKLEPVIDSSITKIVRNKSSVSQETKVILSITKKEFQSWETTSSSTFTLKASAKISLPLSIKIGIEASGSFTTEATRSGGTSKEETETIEVFLTIPPHKALKVYALLSNEAVLLPYTAKGTYILKNNSSELEGSYCELSGKYFIKKGTHIDVQYEEIDILSQTPEVLNPEASGTNRLAYDAIELTQPVSEMKRVEPEKIKRL